MNKLGSRLVALKQKLTMAACQAGHDADRVKLLVVTKGREVADLKPLIAAKQYHFGENYLQEALPKIISLADYPLEWHFIGRLQPNKTRKIAEHFSWVESLDDVHIAQRLSAQRPTSLPPLQVCIQVNIDQDENKGGVSADQLLQLATFIEKLPRLQLRGLMTILKKHVTLAEHLLSYQHMKRLFDQLNNNGFKLDTLSMGMSDDFALAISAGATQVRIGKSIFNQ